MHGHDYFKSLFKRPGVAEAVDILSIHVYHRGPDVVRLESAIRRAHAIDPQKPVWLTEVSVPSEGRHSWISEAWQAEMVFRTATTAMRLGAERIFWHTLVDPPKRVSRRARSGSSSNSLFARETDGSLRRKPAADAFSKLGEVLDGVDWKEVHGINVAGGRGVAIGQKGWLVYGETDWAVVENLKFSTAQILLTGEMVEVAPKSNGRMAIWTDERTVWLQP
jgi:hypothetical protein